MIYKCILCGKEFKGHKSNANRFCSYNCFWKSRQDRVHKHCIHCGKEFYRRPSEEKKGESKYCSEKCYREFNKGDKHYNWKNGITKITYNGIGYTSVLKRKIKELYENKCSNCLSSNNLHIHHIDKNKSNNDIENLILLCASCHMKIHKGKHNA